MKCILVIVSFFLSSVLAVQSTFSQEIELKIYRNLKYADHLETFGADTSSERKLDLYFPKTHKDKKVPVLLFIHGGGFAGGDKNGTEALCAKIASAGFAVLSINYRLYLRQVKLKAARADSNMAKGLPLNGKFHPALQTAIQYASEDTQLALQWIKRNARKYHLDRQAVSLAGGSAGAMTALHTAYISGQNILPIRTVVNLWGGLENASLIEPNSIALLSYHGNMDKIISIDFAYALHKQMKQINNLNQELHILEGKGHASYTLITKEKVSEIAAFLTKANTVNKKGGS